MGKTGYIVAAVVLIFILSWKIIGEVNYKLNIKNSMRRYVNLSDKISWVLPKYGWSHWFSRLPYRVYLYTTIFGFINDGLLLLTIVFGLLLWHFNLDVFYLLILPVTNLIVAIISAITVIKNIKPDPNPFNHR